MIMEIPEGLSQHITTRLIPINGLSAPKQEVLLDNIIIETHPVGSYLFEQGDIDGYVYYLLAGKINMLATDESSFIIDPDVEHASYPIGQMQPRQYSALIINESQILKISKSLFYSLLKSDRQEQQVELADEADAVGDWMTNLVKSRIFSNIPPQNIQKIFELFEEVSVKKNDIIIHQGEPGDFFYIIKDGNFKVTRFLEKQQKTFRLATLHEGDSFGEESLLGDLPRNANVSAISDGILMRLTKDSFLSLIRDPAIKGIDYLEAKQRLKDGGVLLDVRTPDKHRKNGFKGSLNFPLDTLRIHINKLSLDSPYIVYCENGSRSSIAAYLLLKHGYSVCYLRGGILRYQKEMANTASMIKELDSARQYAGQVTSSPDGEKTPGTRTTMPDSTEQMIQSLSQLSQQGGGDQLTRVLRTVLTSVFNQLEQALKDKVEAELARNLAEQKLEAFMQGQVLNLVPAGTTNQNHLFKLDHK